MPFHDAQQRPGQSWQHAHAESEQYDPSAGNADPLLIWDYHESGDTATVLLPLEPAEQITMSSSFTSIILEMWLCF
jgi:hypothetical protein